MSDDMQPIKPEDIAYSETDGALSINAEALVEILNEMRAEIKRLNERARWGSST